MRLMWCDVLINTIYFNSIGFVPEHVVKIVTQLSGGLIYSQALILRWNEKPKRYL